MGRKNIVKNRPFFALFAIVGLTDYPLQFTFNSIVDYNDFIYWSKFCYYNQLIYYNYEEIIRDYSRINV